MSGGNGRVLCEVCPVDEARANCLFVVSLTRHDGAWLFSRKKGCDTWETQGGHVEPGETPEAAACRELYEESGAAPRAMTPVCGYWAERGGERRYGIVYLAEVERLDPLPESEMAEVRRFDALPEKLTYPDITPKLYAEALRVRGKDF